MESTLKIVSVIAGIGAYVPILLSILKNKVRPSFCTWILWTALNVVTLISLIGAHAPYLIASVYTIGTFIIAMLVLSKKQITWDKVDTFIFILVGISVIVLLFAGPVAATIVGSIASFLAGIPELINIYKNPKNISYPTAILLIIANILSILATRNISFINIVYPLAWALYWIAACIISLRRK